LKICLFEKIEKMREICIGGLKHTRFFLFVFYIVIPDLIGDPGQIKFLLISIYDQNLDSRLRGNDK